MRLADAGASPTAWIGRSNVWKPGGCLREKCSEGKMVQLKLREYRHARRLLLAGNSIEAVAAELGGRFTTEELAKQMEKVRAHRAKLDRKRAEQRLEERRNTRPYREQATLSDKYKIPQRVLEDRERRQNAPD